MGSAESSLTDHNLLSNGDMPAWVLIIFEYSNWKTRRNMMIISKRWWRNCNDESFYRFLSRRLAIENGVYVPSILPSNETWKTLFYDLYKLNNIWQSNYNNTDVVNSIHSSNINKKERFKINVYARFCPGKEIEKNDHDDDEKNEIEVTLPLYQRLEMIKISRNIKSNKEALKILAKEGGWFQNRWNHIGNANKHKKKGNESHENEGGQHDILNQRVTKGGVMFDADQNIPSIALRIHEQSYNTNSNTTTSNTTTTSGSASTITNTTDPNRMIACIQTIDPSANRVVTIAPEVGLREFYFNSVLNVQSSQQALYNHTARRLVMDFLNGFNATAIVYGQTGSGKTYSMFGAHDSSTASDRHPSTTTPPVGTYITLKDLEGRGIVPRACEEVFTAIEQRYRTNNIHAEVKVSYVEVFGDEVSDLLKYGARCGQSKVAAQQYVLSGAAERVVTSMDNISEILEIGEKQKRRAATHMNERSTRAHSLFIISLKQTLYNTATPSTGTTTTDNTAETDNSDNNITIKSRLFLADLGGSEQVKKSGVEAGFLREGGTQAHSVGFEMGEHMREAVNINLGLLALKKCIEALNNQALYTPYQDSKLTQLLSAGLGGNSKTSIIICANIDPTHITETIATLRFGEKCSYIELTVKNNISMLESILKDIDNEIKRLEEIISRKERWELENIERKDFLAESNTIEAAIGGMEVKKVYRLIGAEKERKELEQLLIKRAKFIGSDELVAEDSDEESDIDDSDHKKSITTTPSTGTPTSSSSNIKKKSKKAKKIVGFGREYAELYGLGGGYDESMELNNNNTRFEMNIIDKTVIPKSVLLSKGNKNWVTGGSSGVTGETETTAVLEEKARKLKRNKLAYSGISA